MESFFPLLYFGSASYYRGIARRPDAQWVVNERYAKQTLRNRCSIYGANGKIQLSIPVIRPHGKQTPVNEALISYAEPWRQIHWRSIKSAYGRAPYFEYFEDKIAPLYDTKHELLLDFLIDANRIVLDILKINEPSIYSDDIAVSLQKQLDVKSAPEFYYDEQNEYYQIFEDRHGFIPNLSVLDWVFHCGNRF